MTKLLFDPIVVKDSQSDGGLANSASTNEGDWNEVLGKIDYLLDKDVGDHGAGHDVVACVVLPGRGGGGSLGALDAAVRY